MSTWQEIGEKWSHAQALASQTLEYESRTRSMGWQAVHAALDVGDELRRKKLETPKGEWENSIKKLFSNEANSPHLENRTASRTCAKLMRLALHRKLIEKHRPESMNKALALLPKAVKKTSEKTIAKEQEELDKYEQFAKKTARRQAEVLARKKVKLEVQRINNDLYEELKAAKTKLEEEQKRFIDMEREAKELEEMYHALLESRANGYDYHAGIKILKQAVHPDRESASVAVKEKAMDAIRHIEKFLQF